MSGQQAGGQGTLAAFSDGLAAAVARAGASVVRVEARRRQAASGIAWSADGLIVTADHVLERDEDLRVGLPGGDTASATIVGRDPGTDVALLRVDSKDLKPIERGPAPRVGHFALVVGRPGAGLEASIGTVSALGGPVRTSRGGTLDGFIRTDATLYPGFSGGPLIGVDGALIGLATSHFGRGTAMALTVETVERVASALAAHGRVRRGFLGLSSQPVALPESLRQALGLGQTSGLLVVGVEPNGPSDGGGLMIGDVVVSLGGQTVQATEDLRDALGPERVGQVTTVRVIRGGESRELTVTIGERK